MKDYLKYIKGLVLAQLSVPITIGLWALIGIMQVDEAAFEITIFITITVLALVISLPATLAIGLPGSLFLAKNNKLSFQYIVGCSVAVPIFSVIISQHQIIFLAALLPALTGSIIYWYYLKSVGALTSQVSGTR